MYDDDLVYGPTEGNPMSYIYADDSEFTERFNTDPNQPQQPELAQNLPPQAVDEYFKYDTEWSPPNGANPNQMQFMANKRLRSSSLDQTVPFDPVQEMERDLLNFPTQIASNSPLNLHQHNISALNNGNPSNVLSSMQISPANTPPLPLAATPSPRLGRAFSAHQIRPNSNSSTPLSEKIQSEFRISSQDEFTPGSSIPADLSTSNYAAQCIAAADACLLSPYSLSSGEHALLKSRLPHAHITTYLNIRNGILRLWLTNPLVSVTLPEAVGCCREREHFSFAEFAFEWLVREGIINQGCCVQRTSSLTPRSPFNQRKPREHIVVVGAGIAGLSCARQLENLIDKFRPQILSEYDDLPRVTVLEGRKRLGGRVYSPTLDTNLVADLGGDTIAGFGRGNPLSVLLRRQLGIPVVSIDTTMEENVLYDPTNGQIIDAAFDFRAHAVFHHLLNRMRAFEMSLGAMARGQQTSSGLKTLINAGQNPKVSPEEELISIEQHEQESQQIDNMLDNSDEDVEERHGMRKEIEFLHSVQYSTKEVSLEYLNSKLKAEPPTHAASLGLTIQKFINSYKNLTSDITAHDLKALDWYFSKFEYQIGDTLNDASLSSWSHHRDVPFTGRHAWPRQGMSSLVQGLATVPSKLDIRLKGVVTVVEYDSNGCQLTLENGEQISADKVVMTTPLGCLKARSVQFIPDLPQWKLDSIDRLSCGVVNKVVLVFDEPFWNPNTPPIIRVANNKSAGDGSCFLFQNHTTHVLSGEKALIVGLISGTNAKKMHELPDSELVDNAVNTLRKLFNNNPRSQTAKLVESVVTRWQQDRFARGAFSHVGVEGTSTDHDLLGKPVGQRVFFAGEATSRQYPGSIHGAYLSGLRSAKEILNSLVGNLEVPISKPNASRQSSQQPESYGFGYMDQNPPVTQVPQAPQQTGQAVPRIQPMQPPQSVPLHIPPVLDSFAITELENELQTLKTHRAKVMAEKLELAMVHAIGHKPEKPERQGTTNPFLLFQKDYWDICRAETEACKPADKKTGAVHASRNEIRASLGKKWRSLPEQERLPYTNRANKSKSENESRNELFIRKLSFYETEAANFKQQWLAENPEIKSARERQIEEILDQVNPKRKKQRVN